MATSSDGVRKAENRHPMMERGPYLLGFSNDALVYNPIIQVLRIIRATRTFFCMSSILLYCRTSIEALSIGKYWRYARVSLPDAHARNGRMPGVDVSVRFEHSQEEIF
jgi:hypothetical protein